MLLTQLLSWLLACPSLSVCFNMNSSRIGQFMQKPDKEHECLWGLYNQTCPQSSHPFRNCSAGSALGSQTLMLSNTAFLPAQREVDQRPLRALDLCPDPLRGPAVPAWLLALTARSPVPWLRTRSVWRF